MGAFSQNHQHGVVYGQTSIEFSLFYSDRKTMEIAVHPDLSVIVNAPAKTDVPLIHRIIKKRARWILRQLNYFKQFSPRTPKRCYVSGETHLYLGRQYRLKLAVGVEDSVKLTRGFFNITCRSEATPHAVKKLLNQWYWEKALYQFSQSLERCWQAFDGRGAERPTLLIKRMKKRWGSFSGKGTITLNVDLIRVPKECLDYVVTHELCHLEYPNHSAEFYRLLDAVMPGWERIKEKLERSLA